MPSILQIVGILIAAYCSTFIYCFVRNLYYASKSGLPMLVVPWDQNHFVWMVTAVALRPHLEKWLPKSIYKRLRLTIYGWEFHERGRPHKEYLGGKRTYMHVGLGRSEFWTSDAEVVWEVLRRPNDFHQLDLTDLFMARFGHNVLTTNGDRWARQRKVVASVINERISKAVFDESVRQTEGLMDEVYRSSSDTSDCAETNKLFDMMKKITIHVLSGAGMGATVSFSGDTLEKPKPGYKLNYIESVKSVIYNITGPMLLPQWLLANWPSTWPAAENMRTLSCAMREFPVHTKDMIEQERQRAAASKSAETRSNIMSQLLKASESEADMKGNALSEEEMIGNLFLFTIAGFDTTANTLSYALALLARYPAWQDWLLEEVDQIVPSTATAAELDYTTVYPKANRTVAFMLETLRLFTPLIHISKQTATAQTIQTSTGAYWIPPKTTCYVNTILLHLDPAVWRNLNIQPGEESSDDDETLFRPTRWLNPSGSAHVIFQPPRGSYVPWSTGPRVCPGMGMARVEFVTVMLMLLRRNRIQAVCLDGEDEKQAQLRLESRMRKSQSILTLQMEGIYDVKDATDGLSLRLVKRNRE
ncbi:hypothetical protein BAUCODRAFT_75410 [Baudoinia panamericana UAMH 10762]|uniref:Cytochrome P450 n=1 Tax=Baudoinia panamericana (strain UAMH 10762) TaxID=717646 RepID=M2N4G7_BAUPA|nr:uncharacterized protein BAUCODRAFT_75410 [Baudoinia panamericana UAMH 10762]EMC93909.1 hypothetical protein BAUCODRAFT_75410 [Baudoinia panamericana UAMH 10762]